MFMVSLVHATPARYASTLLLRYRRLLRSAHGVSEKFSCTVTIIIVNVPRPSVMQRVPLCILSLDFRNVYSTSEKKRKRDRTRA